MGQIWDREQGRSGVLFGRVESGSLSEFKQMRGFVLLSRAVRLLEAVVHTSLKGRKEVNIGTISVEPVSREARPGELPRRRSVLRRGL